MIREPAGRLLERMCAEDLAECLGVVCGMYRDGMTGIRSAQAPCRVAAKRDQAGEANHMWRGDEAGYQALHLRVEAARGKPHECSKCGSIEGRMEWANLTGNYADVDDYARMCVSCHRNFDAARRRLTGRRTSPKRR